MTDQFEDVVHHVKTPSTWLRILFMLGFCVILYVVSMVVMLLTVAQALFSVFSGSDNSNLRRLGRALTDYVYQILEFITYNSEDRPFPFAPFPEVQAAPTDIDSAFADLRDPAADSVSEPGAASTASASAATKVPRKSSSRKKATPAADQEDGAAET